MWGKWKYFLFQASKSWNKGTAIQHVCPTEVCKIHVLLLVILPFVCCTFVLGLMAYHAFIFAEIIQKRKINQLSHVFRLLFCRPFSLWQEATHFLWQNIFLKAYKTGFKTACYKKTRTNNLSQFGYRTHSPSWFPLSNTRTLMVEKRGSSTRRQGETYRFQPRVQKIKWRRWAQTWHPKVRLLARETFAIRAQKRRLALANLLWSWPTTKILLSH